MLRSGHREHVEFPTATTVETRLSVNTRRWLLGVHEDAPDIGWPSVCWDHGDGTRTYAEKREVRVLAVFVGPLRWTRRTTRYDDMRHERN